MPKIKKIKSSKIRKIKNPDLKIKSYKLRDKKYILLSDFEDQVIKVYKKISDDNYYDWHYEIDNILKYELRNSNNVKGGWINLLSLDYFEHVVSKGLKDFDDPDIIKAFKSVLKSIPKDIEYIDLGF